MILYQAEALEELQTKYQEVQKELDSKTVENKEMAEELEEKNKIILDLSHFGVENSNASAAAVEETVELQGTKRVCEPSLEDEPTKKVQKTTASSGAMSTLFSWQCLLCSPSPSVNEIETWRRNETFAS